MKVLKLLVTLAWFGKVAGLVPISFAWRHCATTIRNHHHFPITTRCASDKNDNDEAPAPTGRIQRLAVRAYHAQDSKPSSRRYTTRKRSVHACHVSPDGLQGDYNHYRTIALQNTTDRAVSLWTADCAEWINSVGSPVQPGDLGENIFLNGLRFDDFSPGVQVVQMGSSPPVVLEITEPVTPCANLCKLSYINDETKTPSQRIRTCQEFLEQLGQWPGLRGWYAKVITPGELQVNDAVQCLTSRNSQVVASP